MTQGHNNDHVLDPRIDAYDPPYAEADFKAPHAYDALLHAWDLFKLVLTRFWTPIQLIALPSVWQSRKLAFLDWLRPIELMLRRTLLIEATAHSATLPPPAPPRPHHTPPAHTTKTVPPFDPDRPESCRVRFGGLARASGKRQRRHRPYDPVDPRERRRTHDPRPLALRLEAVIRVLANPMPYIARLAARLRRQGASPQLAAPARRRIPSALPTLNQLGLVLGMPKMAYPDSS